jgi:hypothetical protein
MQKKHSQIVHLQQSGNDGASDMTYCRMAAVSAAAEEGGSGGHPLSLLCWTCTAPHRVSSCCSRATIVNQYFTVSNNGCQT